MALVTNMPDQEDQQAPSQGAVAPVGGAVRLSPTGGPSTGGTATSGTPGNPPPTAGGQFGSLNQYLTANQGQAQPLANKVTTGIGNQYSNLNTQGNAALNAISGQVAGGASPSQDQTNAIIASESSNPASFSSLPGNVASFQGLLNASYAGPASAESTNAYQNQQNAVNSAISAGQNATSTEAGRENLLSQNEATPTTGVTALNSAILSQSPEALKSIETAYQPFQGLLTNLSTGANTINQQIAQNQAQAKASQQAAGQAITGQINALNTNVGNELTAAQNAATAQNAAVNKDIASGNLTPSDLAALGITQGQWNTLAAANKAAATPETITSANGQFGATTGTTNINPAQYLSQLNPNQVITAANVATPQDYAKAQAFQTLLQGMNLATPTAAINPATAGQAGTAPTDLNTYNYQTALNTANTAASSETAAAQAYVNALQSGADEAHAQQIAQQVAAGKMEGLGATALNTVAMPLTVAENIPVIGAPISKAVNSVVNAVSNATWICTAMRRAGVMYQPEINRLHDHLYRAFWSKPWPFLKYIVLGKPLVMLANYAEVDWKRWKPIFYDMPMMVASPELAVEMYEAGFWGLASHVWCRLKEKK